MNGLQIDLVLTMLVTFALGLCIGRGRVVTIHLILTVISGLGEMIMITNIMDALKLIDVALPYLVLLLGRILAFSGAVSLIMIATRSYAKNT
jgi:hypothetical protein